MVSLYESVIYLWLQRLGCMFLIFRLVNYITHNNSQHAHSAAVLIERGEDNSRVLPIALEVMTAASG